MPCAKSLYRVQIKQQSNHLGGTTANNNTGYTYNQFDLVTDETLSHQTNYGSFSNGKVLKYDLANRLTEVHNANVITSRHNYNAVGQLAEKKLHRLGTTGNNFLQSVDYFYNARGWLRQINQIQLTASGDLNGDIFAQEIAYETGNTPQYNGNISRIEVKAAYPTSNSTYGATDLVFNYSYDALNRLTAANNTAVNISGSTAGNFSEYFQYDPAGNLLTLQRNGKLGTTTFGLIDDLQYSYATGGSNQVKAVQDNVNVGTAETNDFEETNELATEYYYDPNGNMWLDGNKKCMVAYNHLNLPTMVFYPEDGRYILWVYTATGTKLQKYVCSTAPKAVWQSALNYANNNNNLQNPNMQYGKRFAPLSTRRTAANQNLNTQQFYQYTRDSLNTILAQPLTNDSTGTYQEPQSLFDLVGIPNTQANVTCYKHDYIGNIEYQNNQLEAYYTEEGRINLAASNRHEYTIKDHLGNARVCFTPNPSAPTSTLPKILQQTNYYAYGLPVGHLSRSYPLTTGTALTLANKYQYNGIELNDDFGLNINTARYRTLDPQLGRWWQLDPEVEQFYAWTPYNSNLGNPIRYEDRDGATPITLAPALAAGATGFLVDVAFQADTNVYNGEPFYKVNVGSTKHPNSHRELLGCLQLYRVDKRRQRFNH